MTDVNFLLNSFKNFLIEHDLSKNTIDNYANDVRSFIKWYQGFFGNTPIEECISHHANTYKEYIIQSLRLKTSSINRKIQTLKFFFRFMIEKELIKEDPIKNIKSLKKVKNLKPSSLNRSEVHALLSIAARSEYGANKRNYAIIQLILQTGLRVSEVIRLQWQDIKLSERSGQVRVVDGKGHKEREVPLNASARRALSSYIEESGRTLIKNDIFFVGIKNRPLTTRAIQKMVSILSDKANITRVNVTPHALRHTFATNYLRANPGSIVELAALLGHESLDTTAIYTKASEEHLLSTLEDLQFV